MGVVVRMPSRVMARLVSEEGGAVFEVPPGETVVGRGPLLKVLS